MINSSPLAGSAKAPGSADGRPLKKGPDPRDPSIQANPVMLPPSDTPPSLDDGYQPRLDPHEALLSTVVEPRNNMSSGGEPLRSGR